MSIWLIIVGVVVLIIWVVSIADIAMRKMGAKKTAGWILVVVLLPALGSLLYWALRRPSADELDETVGARADLRGAQPRPPGGGPHIY